MAYEMRKYQRVCLRQIMYVDGKTAVLNNVSVNGLLVSCRWLPASRAVSVNVTINEQEFQLEGIVQWVRRQSTSRNYHEMGILIPNAPEPYVDVLEWMYGET